MHDIEPFFNWEKHYVPNKDQRSPFYGVTYNTQEYENAIYGYYIHPFWDFIGSETLYVKVLYANYHENFVVIELMGEWNDTLHNDIMHLKRNVIDLMVHEGITKYIIIAENILNFHGLEDDYYEEWFDEVEDGWIAMVNFHEHVISEFERANIDHYFLMGGELEEIEWRTYLPQQFFDKVESLVSKRLS